MNIKLIWKFSFSWYYAGYLARRCRSVYIRPSEPLRPPPQLDTNINQDSESSSDSFEPDINNGRHHQPFKFPPTFPAQKHKSHTNHDSESSSDSYEPDTNSGRHHQLHPPPFGFDRFDVNYSEDKFKDDRQSDEFFPDKSGHFLFDGLSRFYISSYFLFNGLRKISQKGLYVI